MTMSRELSADFQDALAIASVDPVRIAAHLRSHTNGADLEHLLIAAIDVAREQSRQIAELKASLEESEDQNTFLEEEIDGLRKSHQLPEQLFPPDGGAPTGALPGTDAIRELKLVTQLLCRHEFRCLSVREKTGNQTRENEDG